MQVYIVSPAEVREHLSELIALVAAGNHVVIAENGKSVATLGKPPMFPTTPEEVEATRAVREEAVRAVKAMREAHSASDNGFTSQELRDEHRQCS